MNMRWPAICIGLFLCLAVWPAGADPALPTSPQAGDIPPDTLGTDRDGEDITVSQYKGKVVIVTFWASWCGPCRRELPVLGKVQSAVGREHLEVIAVNFKEDRREFNAVVRANKDIALHYIRDPQGAISDSYGITAVPHMFIIGLDGKVAHVHRGYSQEMIGGFVEEMLALLPPEALSRPAGS